MGRSLKLSWIGPLAISLTLVLSAIGCGNENPLVTGDNVPGLDGHPPGNPAPIPTDTPVPTATQSPTTQTLGPLLESFYGSASVSKQVGPHIHELEWGLINRSQEQVTILSAETQTVSGELVAQVPQSFMEQYWSGGNMSPGGQLSSVVDFPGRPTPEDLQWRKC